MFLSLSRRLKLPQEVTLVLKVIVKEDAKEVAKEDVKEDVAEVEIVIPEELMRRNWDLKETSSLTLEREVAEKAVEREAVDSVEDMVAGVEEVIVLIIDVMVKILVVDVVQLQELQLLPLLLNKQ